MKRKQKKNMEKDMDEAAKRELQDEGSNVTGRRGK